MWYYRLSDNYSKFEEEIKKYIQKTLIKTSTLTLIHTAHVVLLVHHRVLIYIFIVFTIKNLVSNLFSTQPRSLFVASPNYIKNWFLRKLLIRHDFVLLRAFLTLLDPFWTRPHPSFKTSLQSTENIHQLPPHQNVFLYAAIPALRHVCSIITLRRLAPSGRWNECRLTQACAVSFISRNGPSAD